MDEYINAFLDLGEQKDSIGELRHVLMVLRTTVLYMTERQWKRYQELLERIPRNPKIPGENPKHEIRNPKQ